jgi:hypothetical protein
MQNLVEAGIKRFDFEAVAVPIYPGLVGLAGEPDWSWQGRWLRGYRFRSGKGWLGGILPLRRFCTLRGVGLCGKILSAQDCRHDQKREDRKRKFEKDRLK